jgi:hypothetical protein
MITRALHIAGGLAQECLSRHGRTADLTQWFKGVACRSGSELLQHRRSTDLVRPFCSHNNAAGEPGSVGPVCVDGGGLPCFGTSQLSLSFLV